MKYSRFVCICILIATSLDCFGQSGIDITGTMTGGAKTLNAIRFADQFSGATVTAKMDAAIVDCGSADCLVVIPSTMGSSCPTSIPHNITLLDLRGTNNGTIPCGDGSLAINSSTGTGAGGVDSLLRVLKTYRNIGNNSVELQTNAAAFTGDMTGSNGQSLEALTSDARIWGNITNVPASQFLVGMEAVARSWQVTSGATMPWARAFHGGCFLDGSGSANNGNITACTKFYSKQAATLGTNTGTMTSAYGYVGEREILGSTNNYSSWLQGSQLFNDGTNGGINFDWCTVINSIADCSAKLTWQTVDASKNIVHYTLGATEEWRPSAGSNPWMKFNTPNVDFDANSAGYLYRFFGAVKFGGSGGASISGGFSGSGTLTYTAISANACQEQPITVTGATTGKACWASPAADIGSNFSFGGCRVSASNTVRVRVCSGAGGTPSTQTWTAWVLQ